MAWNEPGGGRKDQDPWRAKQDKGPPDLDEVVKKLQDKFGGLFGGGKSNGADGKSGMALVGVLIILAALVWGFAGLYRVEQAEQALVLRFGKFHEIVGAGLHWNPRLVDSIYKVDVTKVNQVNLRATMLTEDQNIVDITLDVQFRVDDPKAFFLEIASPEAALRHSTESALRHVVGASEMGSVITEGREAIAVDVHARLQDYLNRYDTGLSVTKVNIEDAHPPKEVKAAFDDVIKAKEDEERLLGLLFAGYSGRLGVIGSKAKWNAFTKVALSSGIEQNRLDQVNCPIGLEIGAESPEEIAIAVLAEILAAHKGVTL